MRCLALAEEFAANGWTIWFAVRAGTPSIVTSLAVTVFRLIEFSTNPENEIERMRTAVGSTDIVVIDHYDLDEKYEYACRSFADKIFVIDDIATRRHDCDFILDSSQHPSSLKYDGVIDAKCQRLYGPNYALIRSEIRMFRPKALKKPRNGDVCKIFVSFGSMDIGGMTCVALEAIKLLKRPLEVFVALNSASPSLNSISINYPDAAFLLDSTNIGQVMLEADVAIGAAGTTAWERCHLALPSIIVTTADNQISIARTINDNGAGIYAGEGSRCGIEKLAGVLEMLISNGDHRASMAMKAAKLVDGNGARRVFEVCCE